MSTVVIAQGGRAADLTGWYVGFGIGMTVVVILAILVGWILYLALEIGIYARLIDEALQQSEVNTRPLAALKTTIDYAVTIIGGLQRGRAKLGG